MKMTNSKTMKMPSVRRSMKAVIDGAVRTAPDGTTTVRVAISSEYPVYRGDWPDGPGMEVLQHTAGAIDLSILNNSGPFCVEHDVTNQVGVLSNVTLDPDKVLRGDVRFSRSLAGQTALNDIVDGIRPHISVGYVIKKIRIERDGSGQTTYVVTSWMPYEVSTVSLPADPTVGVGRSDASQAEVRDVTIENDDLDTKRAELIAKVVETLQDLTELSNRSVSTDDDEDDSAEEDTSADNEDDEDADATTDSGAEADTSADNVGTTEADSEATDEEDDDEEDKQRGQVPEENMADRSMENATMKETATPVVSVGTDAEAVRKNATEIATLASEHGLTNKTAEWLQSGRSVESIAKEILQMKSNTRSIETADPVVLTDKEQKQYSIVRAINSAVAGKRSGFEMEISDEIAQRTGRQAQGFYMPTSIRTALTSAGSGTGAELVFTQAGSFIDLLRNRTKVVSLGAQVFPGVRSKIAFPRQTATGAATWFQENGSAPSEANVTFDQVTLSPKALVCPQAVSKQLLALDEIDAEAIVRADIANNFAVAIDAAALNGLGVGSYQPLGIFGQTGVGVVSLAPSGSAITYAACVAMETAVATANADVANMAYLFSPGVAGNLKTTLMNPSGSNSQFVWQDGTVNGYRAEVTNNIPQTLSKGGVNNLHGAVFGDWTSLVIAEYGAIDLVIDPYTYASQMLIKVTGTMMCDVAVRTPGSFSIIKDIVKN